jgi:hypothetical protein
LRLFAVFARNPGLLLDDAVNPDGQPCQEVRGWGTPESVPRLYGSEKTAPSEVRERMPAGMQVRTFDVAA